MALRAVVLNEVRLLRADRLLRAVLILFGVLFAYALVNGVAWVRFQERTIADARAAVEGRTRALGDELAAIAAGAPAPSPFRDPRAPNVLGGARGARTAVLEPGPLAALSIGQSDLLPYYYDVSIYTNEQTFLQNGEVENPLNLMVGRFDLSFVLVYLLPLLILTLSYNVLSAEREQGTLAITLAQPVSARMVVAAKLLFRGAVVVGLALAVSLAGALLTGGAAVPHRVALWCATVTAYAVFWFGLAACVNTLRRSSAWNAMVLVGAWILLVVVLPAAINIAAGVLHPLPSRVEMITAQRDASNEAVNRRSELLARYLEDHPEMAGGVVAEAASSAALAWAATEEVNQRLQDVASQYRVRLDAQRALVRRYRLLSPALLTQEVFNEVAGTGDARYAHFQEGVRAFAEEWKAFFVPPILAGDQMSAEVAAGIPTFSYLEEAEASVFARSVGPLLALLGFALVVVVPGATALGRLRGAV
jgi:ABC-2 type transport system permease protein